MHNDILKLAYEVSSITEKKVVSIDTVVRQARFLAINTRIEAARAGAGGDAFSVFADEMRDVATTITAISAELRAAISESTARLAETGSRLVIATKGARFADLALNVIDIIDRNLYERSCDVRWWATDSAVVAALEAGDEESLRHATGRLRIILNPYTVYLDLCIVDRSGVVVACGRPDLYPRAVGQNFSQASWFRDAMQTRSGDEYAAGGVQHVPALNGAAAATYATAIRQGGHLNGRILGVLGILFDWTPQSSAVVTGVRLTPEEQSSTRVMIVDAHYHILAASDGARSNETSKFPT